MGGISRWHADVSVLAVSVFANCQGLRIEGSGKCIKKFWTNCEHQEMQIGHDTYRVSLCWLFWTLEVWKLPESPAAKNSCWKLRSAPRSKSISNRLRLTPNNSFCYRCPQTFSYCDEIATYDEKLVVKCEWLGTIWLMTNAPNRVMSSPLRLKVSFLMHSAFPESPTSNLAAVAAMLLNHIFVAVCLLCNYVNSSDGRSDASFMTWIRAHRLFVSQEGKVDCLNLICGCLILSA